MTKIVEKAREGFEVIVSEMDNILANIDIAKQNELEEFKISLDSKYADRVDRANKIRSEAVELVEVEVEDEVNETVEEPTVENVDGETVIENQI